MIVLLSASRMSEDTGLAIVIDLTERRRADLEVEERLRFERLVSELVAAFATAPEDRAEALVPRWLGHLGRFLEADRVTLQVFATQQMRLRPSYSWAAGGADPRPLILQDTEFPYAWARLQRGESVLIELLDALPAEAATDREHFERQGIAAVLAIPLVLSGQLFGALILAYGAPAPGRTTRSLGSAGWGRCSPTWWRERRPRARCGKPKCSTRPCSPLSRGRPPFSTATEPS